MGSVDFVLYINGNPVDTLTYENNEETGSQGLWALQFNVQNYLPYLLPNATNIFSLVISDEEFESD